MKRKISQKTIDDIQARGLGGLFFGDSKGRHTARKRPGPIKPRRKKSESRIDKKVREELRKILDFPPN